MDHLLASVLYLVAIVNLLMAIVVLKSDQRRTENRLFAIFLFAAVFWAIGDALMLYADNYELAKTGLVLFYVSPLLTTLFVVLFSLVFPNEKPVKTWVIYVLSVPAIILFALMSTNPDIFLKSLQIVPQGQNLIEHHPTQYKLYSLYFNIYFFISYVALYISYRRSRGEDKKRVAYAFWAILLTSIGALYTNLTLPILGRSQYVFAGPMFLLLFSGVVTLGIIRHKFFDIRLVLARSLGYFLSIFALSLIYGFLTFNIITELFFGNAYASFWQRVTYTLLAVVIAFTFQPLKRFFDKWTNRIFYQDAYDPQALIDELNQTLVSTMDLNKMLKASSEILEKHIKPEFCVFGLRETEYEKQRIIGNTSHKFSEKDISLAKEFIPQFRHKVIIAEMLDTSFKDIQSRMRRNSIAAIVRLTSDVDHEGIGVIVLGVKRSGGSYNSQDLRVLEIIANSMVIAIENALKFEEIQKFNISLEQKVESATRRLRHTNEKLQALDETKDEFISMASHQLRTPLTSIKGYVSMVIEGDAGELNAQQKKLLEQAFISSQRMVYLISDLLNVSRLRTGKFVIEKSQVDLAELVAGEVDQLKDTAKARGLKLIYKKPKDIPIMDLDETKIRQVVMNFMDNAIYYSGQGKEILVELEAKPRSLEFRVNDQGIGVPKNHQHQLFSKFYRAENAKRARPDGTGLGLFMAKKVIIAQGGAIIFRSTEGKGSTFGFTFPLPAKKI